MNQVSKHSILGKILLGIPSPQKNRPEITTALLSLRAVPERLGYRIKRVLMRKRWERKTTRTEEPFAAPALWR